MVIVLAMGHFGLQALYKKKKKSNKGTDFYCLRPRNDVDSTMQRSIVSLPEGKLARLFAKTINPLWHNVI